MGTEDNKGKFDGDVFGKLGATPAQPAPPAEPPAEPPSPPPSPPPHYFPTPARPPAPPSPQGGGSGAKAVRAVFVVLGLVASVLACIYVYRDTSSWWLVIFTFCWTQWFVGRGIGRILTYPHKVQRVFYYLVPLLIGVGALYLADRWWHTNWLSALLGLFIGGMLGLILVTIVFPRVAEQERTDYTGSAKAQFGL